MNRKEFITSASIIAIGSVSAPLILPAAATLPDNYLPVIDTHQHLWDTVRFKEGWSPSPLKRSFNMNDYQSAIQGLNIVKSVYIEVAVPPVKRHEEALYAVELCKDQTNPMSGAVIAADLNSKGFKAYMSEFKNERYIKGIRYRFMSEEEITSPLIIENVRLLGKMGRSFDFSVQTKWLPHMAKLISRCPQTRFMVNHCGNADPRAFFGPEENLTEKPAHDKDEWIRDITRIAGYKNTACKISGVITRAINHPLNAKNLAPAVNACLDIFGPDRVMFASDWPVSLRKMELKSWLSIVREIVGERPFKEQKKLFHDNALKLYRLGI